MNLAKLPYFANLDFPEIRESGISLPKSYLLGEIGLCDVAIQFDQTDYFYV